MHAFFSVLHLTLSSFQVGPSALPARNQSAWVALPPNDGGQEASALEAELFPVPHTGLLHLGLSGGMQWVTNQITHERIKCPGVGCTVDEQAGFYVLLRTTEDPDDDASPPTSEVIILEKEFKKVLMKNSHGEMFFVPVSLGVPQPALAQSWSVGQSKFRTASLSCRIESRSADLSFTQYAWLVPRSGGCRVYWDMSQVFRSMFPNLAGGLPSAWLKGKRQPWDNLASSCLSDGKH